MATIRTIPGPDGPAGRWSVAMTSAADKRTEMLKRREDVLNLLVSGESFQVIADRLGFRTAAAAAQESARALKDRKKILDAQAELAVTLETERLDSLSRTAQDLIDHARLTKCEECEQVADPEMVLKAIDRQLRLAERRARLRDLDMKSPAAGQPAAAAAGRQPDECGPIEAKVREDVSALVTTHPMGEALTEMSFRLARTLDQGAGLATAAVNRELRANLTELSGMAADADDDFADELSAPVRDTEEPG